MCIYIIVRQVLNFECGLCYKPGDGFASMMPRRHLISVPNFTAELPLWTHHVRNSWKPIWGARQVYWSTTTPLAHPDRLLINFILEIDVTVPHTHLVHHTSQLDFYDKLQFHTKTKEREVSRVFDIGHWTFECPVSNIEYPANFTLLQNEVIIKSVTVFFGVFPGFHFLISSKHNGPCFIDVNTWISNTHI